MGLFNSVTQFLRHRRKLRRLDLGNCPWDLVSGVLPHLTGLRVLGVRIASVNDQVIKTLVSLLPEEMCAINLSTAISDQSLHEYAPMFGSFPNLSFLHFQATNKHRPKPNLMSEKDYLFQTEMWHSSVRRMATSIKTLDFVGWHGEHYVIVRSGSGSGPLNVELKELPARRRLDCGKGVDLGTDDASWLERKDVPIDYEMPGVE
ncbi:hypothetical protein ONZ45_g8814 [Pleurotus djamor]|nr:hypothetical protein ONZ45_g8814 [Pleurotus djamor]